MGNSGTVQISLDKQEAPPLNPPIDYSDMYPPLSNTTWKKNFDKDKGKTHVSSNTTSSNSENKIRSEMNNSKPTFIGAGVDYSYTVRPEQISFKKIVLIYSNNLIMHSMFSDIFRIIMLHNRHLKRKS